MPHRNNQDDGQGGKYVIEDYDYFPAPVDRKDQVQLVSVVDYPSYNEDTPAYSSEHSNGNINGSNDEYNTRDSEYNTGDSEYNKVTGDNGYASDGSGDSDVDNYASYDNSEIVASTYGNTSNTPSYN